MAKEEENQTLYSRAEVNLFIEELGGSSRIEYLKKDLKINTWCGDKINNKIRSY